MSFRPHITKLKTGQATFCYMPVEDAEKYETVLLNYEKSADSVEEFNYALGLHKNKLTNKWELVTIKYNSVTKQVVISEVEELFSTQKNHAETAFKKAATRLKIV